MYSLSPQLSIDAVRLSRSCHLVLPIYLITFCRITVFSIYFNVICFVFFFFFFSSRRRHTRYWRDWSSDVCSSDLGPITANNPMGVHHAWGRTYKDLFQRYQTMLGKRQRYQNGFDCQGLWVEVEVEKELGLKSKRDIEEFGIAEFVERCKQRVLTFADRITSSE